MLEAGREVCTDICWLTTDIISSIFIFCHGFLQVSHSNRGVPSVDFNFLGLLSIVNVPRPELRVTTQNLKIKSFRNVEAMFESDIAIPSARTITRSVHYRSCFSGNLSFCWTNCHLRRHRQGGGLGWGKPLSSYLLLGECNGNRIYLTSRQFLRRSNGERLK